IEARVVGDGDGVAHERKEAANGVGRIWGAAQLLAPQTDQRAHARGDRKPWVDQGLELRVDLEAAEAHGSDLADSGLSRPQSRRLAVDYHVRCVLQQERGTAPRRARDRISAP